MRDYVLELAFDDPSAEELIQSRLFLTESTGSISSDGLISAWFESAEARHRAADLLRGMEGVDMRMVERQRVDWLELYRQSLEPLFIGERFVIAPDPSLIPREGGRLTLVVPQEQAFGTGSHETTSLCIELLESLELAGKRGLDVGAGSGILAMAMLRLGAAKAIAFDNDLDAYGALRDNRARNGMAPDRLPLFIGGIEALRAGAFEVVTMNIIPEVIVPLLPQVRARMGAGAALIVSGVLNERRGDVVDPARAAALTLSSEKTKGEWWAGVLAVR